MVSFRVQDLEICQELGINLGPAERKKAILDKMRADDVAIEEVNEAWDIIQERKRQEALWQQLPQTNFEKTVL